MVFSWVVAGLQQLEQYMRYNQSTINLCLPITIAIVIVIARPQSVVLQTIAAVAFLRFLYLFLHGNWHCCNIAKRITDQPPADVLADSGSQKPDPVDDDSGSEHAEATG